MSDSTYEQDLEIDPGRIDYHLTGQAQAFFKYAKESARLNLEFANSKEELDVKRASLDAEIRKTPEAFGIAKITEAQVSSTIDAHPSYREVLHAHNMKKYELDLVQAAVRAMDHRKSALENLVRLHHDEYFAGPSVPNDLIGEYKGKKANRVEEQEVINRMRSKRTTRTRED